MTGPDIGSPPSSCVVYTPPALADAMVAAVGGRKEGSWLEPSCGRGVFVESLLKSGVAGASITILDLEPEPGPFDKAVVANRGMDFLAWAAACSQRFDGVVGNPPYVRISELPDSLRQSAAAVRQPDGDSVGLRANSWYAFVCAALNLLKPGAAIAFVLPAAWEYADYAAPVRNKMGRWFRSVRVYRCLRPLFEGVLDGSVVLIAEGWGSGPGAVSRSEHATAEELLTVLCTDSIRRVDDSEPVRPESERFPTVRLGEVMSIRIGGVTGDSDFFLLREGERRARQIPTTACLPAVTRSSHLGAAFVDRTVWKRLRDANERVWLFRPSAGMALHPHVKNYLELPEGQGGCRRNALKVRERKPWYHTRLPAAADAFLSGNRMTGPWLAFRDMRHLTATNTLYVAMFRGRLERKEKLAWALAMLTSTAFESWRSCVRVYPDGLQKAEPGDIAEVRLPRPKCREGAEVAYRHAVSLLLGGDSSGARRLAEAWICEEDIVITSGQVPERPDIPGSG